MKTLSGLLSKSRKEQGSYQSHEAHDNCTRFVKSVKKRNPTLFKDVYVPCMNMYHVQDKNGGYLSEKRVPGTTNVNLGIIITGIQTKSPRLHVPQPILHHA